MKKDNRNKYNHQHHHSKIRRKLLDDELSNSRRSNDTNYSESNKYRPYEKRLRLPYELDENQKREELKENRYVNKKSKYPQTENDYNYNDFDNSDNLTCQSVRTNYSKIRRNRREKGKKNKDFGGNEKDNHYYDNNSNTYYALFSNKSQIASHILDFNKNPIILSLKKNEQNNDQSNDQKNEQNSEQNIEQYNNLLKFCTMLLEQLTKYYIRNNKENQDVIGDIRRESKLEKNDNFTEKNMNTIILMICELCIRGELEGPKNKSTLCIPDYAALNIYIIFYVKENIDKLKKFRQMINGIVNFFHKDYMISGANLNQRAYFRLFYNLIYFLNKNSNNETILDSDCKRINYLYKISEFLEKISPSKYPIFAMGWLELISCNLFITNFLEPPLNMLHSKKKGVNEKMKNMKNIYYYLLNF
jgi:hypothetical protein